MAGAFGWRETVSLAEDCNANVFWYERAITVGEVRHLNEHQRVNMIPGMHEMARKASLARALNRLRTLYPDEFAFYPRTWTLPAQLGEFRQHCVDRAAAGATDDVYIAKPSGGCQGAGIYLLRARTSSRRTSGCSSTTAAAGPCGAAVRAGAAAARGRLQV